MNVETGFNIFSDFTYIVKKFIHIIIPLLHLIIKELLNYQRGHWYNRYSNNSCNSFSKFQVNSVMNLTTKSNNCDNTPFTPSLTKSLHQCLTVFMEEKIVR